MGIMLRWTILLCCGLYLVFVLGPDPEPAAAPVDQIEVDVEPAAPRDEAQVTLESGETWSIDRVIGEEVAATDVEPQSPAIPATSDAPAVAPETADPTAIEGALAEAQSDETATETAAPQEDTATLNLLYVTGTRVNLRAGPSTNDTIVTALTQGTAVEWVSEAPDGWLEIRDVETGARGFMSGDFLSPDAP